MLGKLLLTDDRYRNNKLTACKKEAIKNALKIGDATKRSLADKFDVSNDTILKIFREL